MRTSLRISNSLQTAILQGIFAPRRELPSFSARSSYSALGTCALNSLLVRAGNIHPGSRENAAGEGHALDHVRIGVL